MSRFLLCLLLCGLCVTGVSAQIAPVPSLMHFQGRLTKPDGTPIADDSYFMRFSLYDAATGGTEKWHQTIRSITVRNGTFAVLLSGLPSETFRTDLWLEIKVGPDAPLTPRQQLASVAYAMKADSVKDGAITGASIANGTLTADKFAAGTLNPLAWLLGGNSSTNPATQFLGTTDVQPLVFRTNNTEKMRLLSNGKLGIGTSTPAQQLDVRGQLQVQNTVRLDPVNEPIIVRQYDNFTSGAKNGFGRWGLFMEPFTLFLGVAGSDYTYTSRITLGGWTADSTREDWLTVMEGGYVGIGTIMPTNELSVIGNADFSGNVGIGISSPEAKLHVMSGNIRVDAGQYQSRGPIVLHPDIDNSGDDVIRFLDSAGDETMRVHSNGNVGIGTNTPKQQLHNTGDYYGKGHVWLHAFEGDGSSGTAYVQARDTSGTTNLGLMLRSQNAGTAIDALYIAPNGQVGIGTYSSGYQLTVNGNVAGIGPYVNVSDTRYKQNVATFPNALDTVLNLRGVTFDWKRADFPSMNFSDGHQIGFIAQEVEKVLPELVMTDRNGYKSVAYANVVPVLVEAMKQQQKQIAAQQAQIETLRGENTELKAMLSTVLQRLEQREGK